MKHFKPCIFPSTKTVLGSLHKTSGLQFTYVAFTIATRCEVVTKYLQGLLPSTNYLIKHGLIGCSLFRRLELMLYVSSTSVSYAGLHSL